MFKDKVNMILSELCLDSAEITPEMRLKEDLGLDSLNLVEFIVALEDSLGVEFKESDLDPEAMLTVSDLWELAEKYDGEKNDAV